MQQTLQPSQTPLWGHFHYPTIDPFYEKMVRNHGGRRVSIGEIYIPRLNNYGKYSNDVLD